MFGANYIKGKVISQPNGNWEGEAKFKLHFKSGGAIDFGTAMLRAAQMGENFKDVFCINNNNTVCDINFLRRNHVYNFIESGASKRIFVVFDVCTCSFNSKSNFSHPVLGVHLK